METNLGTWTAGPYRERNGCCEINILNERGTPIATVYGENPDLKEQMKAEARAMAAAPELLAACQVAEIEMDRMQWAKCDFQTLGERLKLVRAAIAHATGQE
jgi:hypothetical protein